MVRLLQADSRATVTQITTHYNQVMKSISRAAEDHTRYHSCQLNAIIEDWNNIAWYQHGNMDPPYLVSTIQACGGYFFGKFWTFEHILNTTGYQLIVVISVYFFVTTLLLSSSRITHHVSKLKKLIS